MTLLHDARNGVLAPQVALAAAEEGISPEMLRVLIAAGKAILPRNRKRREVRPVAIGEGLRIKVNANVGSSRDRADVSLELAKMRVAVAAGADAVMDLSTGGPIDDIRRAILEECPVPVGTVPVYQAAADAVTRGKSWVELTPDDFFDGIVKQAEDGVDFMTVHCGVTREALERLIREGRRLDIVSRGGSLLAEWMEYNERENPFYEHFDRLVDICREFDITISLGDGLRPGCLADATDRAQVHELMMLGELTERAWEKDVQVMIEGPGHVPMNQIAANVNAPEASLPRGAVLRSRPPRHRHRPGVRSHHLRDRGGDRRVERCGLFVLRDAVRAPAAPVGRGRQRGGDRVPHRRPRRRHRARDPGSDGQGQPDGRRQEEPRLESPDRAVARPGAGARAARGKHARGRRVRLHDVRRPLCHQDLAEGDPATVTAGAAPRNRHPRR